MGVLQKYPPIIQYIMKSIVNPILSSLGEISKKNSKNIIIVTNCNQVYYENYESKEKGILFSFFALC